MSLVRGNVGSLSLDKYGSQVCERILVYTSEEGRCEVIEEILADDANGLPGSVWGLIHSEYGSKWTQLVGLYPCGWF